MSRRFILELAMLNAWRSRRRTLLSAGIIAAGAAGAALFDGYMQNTYANLEATFTHARGHLQIARTGYFGSTRPEELTTPSATLAAARAALAKAPGLAGHVVAAPTITSLRGLASTGELTAPFAALAVEPREYAAMAPAGVGAARLATAAAVDPHAVVLGAVLAAKIKARVGDWISISTPLPGGRLNAMDVKVAAVARPRGQELDEFYVLMSDAAARELRKADQAEVLAVYLDGGADLEAEARAARQAIAGVAPGLEVARWDVTTPYYRSVRSLYERLFGVIRLVLLAVVLAGSANATAMIVASRAAETGMLRAVGAGRAQITGLFLTESLMTTAGGALAGLALAAAIALTVRLAGGIPMPPPPGFAVGYPLFFALNAHGGFVIMFLSLLAAAAASLVPARRAAHTGIARLLGRGLPVFALAALLAGAAAPAFARDVTANDVLKAVDRRREVPEKGFLTEVSFTSYVSGQRQDGVKFRVAGKDGESIALETSDAPGSRMAVLSKGKGMWMQKEGMRKPFRVSPAQRLLGAASVADVITVQYGTDYRATEVSEAKGAKGKVQLVLKPRQGNESAAYGEIRIVTTTDGIVTRGEFYALSGKLLKTAKFKYNGSGRLEEAVVQDAVNKDEVTRVGYGPMAARELGESEFNPQSLLDAALKLAP